MRTRKKRKRQMRINTKVDFTPMVDMLLLLLTFFMFCTTLSKPQVMDIAMPIPIEGEDIGDPTVPQSQAITFILASKNKVYYYEGMPDYEDYTSLKEIDYKELRNVLAKKNRHIIAQVNAVRKKLSTQKVSEDVYIEMTREIKKQKNAVVAVIKPTTESLYHNLVDVLDEMQICSVGRYSVVDIAKSDEYLIENYESKGLYAQENSMK